MGGSSGQHVIVHRHDRLPFRRHLPRVRRRHQGQAQADAWSPRHRLPIDTDDRLRSRRIQDHSYAGHAVFPAVIVFLRIAARLARTLAISSGLGPSIIGTGFFGVVGTDIPRSRTSEASFRSFDAGRMLDQSRWHRHCPGVRARRGPSAGPDGQQGPSDGRSDRCWARECH